MTLAFVNLVFISSILDGLLVAIDDQVKTNFVSNIVIEPQKEPEAKSYISHAENISRQVEQIKGVVAAVPRYSINGTISFDKDKKGNFVYQPAQIVSIDPVKDKKISQIWQQMVAGEYLESPGKGTIILGADLSGGFKPVDDPNSLGGAKVDDKINVVFGNGVEREYRIKGIFKTYFAPIDAMAFITNKDAESVLSLYDSASQIIVKTDSSQLDDFHMQQIEYILPNLEVRKWSDYIGIIGDLSSTFGMIGSVVSFIGLIVAAITIFMLVFISTRQKRRQLGILKAIGVPHEIIIYSYLVQTLFYWLLGIIIGLVIIFFAVVPYFSSNPLETPIGKTGVNIDISAVIFNIISLLIATFIGGLIPSWKGARENIIKSIWGS